MDSEKIETPDAAIILTFSSETENENELKIPFLKNW